MFSLTAIPLLIAGFMVLMLTVAKAWTAIRGLVLLILGGLSLAVAISLAPIHGFGHASHRAGPLSTELGMVLTAFAVAFALFGVWQLLLGIVRLARRGPIGFLVALALVGCVVAVLLVPLFSFQMTTGAATA